MVDLPKWFSFLPCPIAYSTRFSPNGGLETQDMEGGLVIQRRKHRNLPGPAAREFVVTDAEANIITACYQAWAGGEFLVDLKAPGRFGELKAYRCRFLKFPDFQEHSPGKQRCSLELHIAALDVPALSELAVPGTEFLGAEGDVIAAALDQFMRVDAPPVLEDTQWPMV